MDCMCGCGQPMPENKNKGSKFISDQHRAEYHRKIYLAGLQAVNPSEQKKKDEGMESAARHFSEQLRIFRTIAESIPGLITIDTVRREAELQGIKYEPGPWLGSVFKRGFKWTGAVTVSTHEGSHGRLVRIWERI